MLTANRRFLVKNLPADLKPNDDPCEFTRGFLSFAPEMSITRQYDAGRPDVQVFFLETKLHPEGLNRTGVCHHLMEQEEYESLKSQIKAELTSTRQHFVLVEGKAFHRDDEVMAEVFSYHGALEGLRIVEVELEGTKQVHGFTPPDWFGEEVADKPEYDEASLAKRPEFFSLTPKEKSALTEAADAIYFKDNSKYLPALWSVVHALVGDRYDDDIEDGKLFPILHPGEDKA